NPPWCCHQKRSYSVWRNWNFATSFSCLWTVPWEYVKGHARSVSNLHSASAAPLSFRSRHLPAVLDYCLDRNDFHGVSRAEGPSQLTWPTGSWPETGLARINGDLLEADLSGVGFQIKEREGLRGNRFHRR